MEHIEGKVFLSGHRLKEMLDEFHDTDCGRDCKIRITQDNKLIDIEIRLCSNHAQCFVKLLQSTRSIN